MESPLARDALSELMNVGSGNAVTSLTRLLRHSQMTLSLPLVLSGDEVKLLPDLAADGIVVSLVVEGAISFTFLAMFDLESAKKLAGALAGGEIPELGIFEQSAVVETVNIISCSFLGALASMLKDAMVPHAPRAYMGRLADVVAAVATPGLIALTNDFAESESGVRGRILLLADGCAAARMLSAVGIAAEEQRA